MISSCDITLFFLNLRIGSARQQRNPTVIAKQTQLWTRLILSYARSRRLFTLKLEDAEQRSGTDWADIFYNPRIKREFIDSCIREIVKSRPDMSTF